MSTICENKNSELCTFARLATLLLPQVALGRGGGALRQLTAAAVGRDRVPADAEERGVALQELAQALLVAADGAQHLRREGAVAEAVVELGQWQVGAVVAHEHVEHEEDGLVGDARLVQ